MSELEFRRVGHRILSGVKFSADRIGPVTATFTFHGDETLRAICSWTGTEWVGDEECVQWLKEHKPQVKKQGSRVMKKLTDEQIQRWLLARIEQCASAVPMRHSKLAQEILKELDAQSPKTIVNGHEFSATRMGKVHDSDKCLLCGDSWSSASMLEDCPRSNESASDKSDVPSAEDAKHLQEALDSVQNELEESVENEAKLIKQRDAAFEALDKSIVEKESLVRDTSHLTKELEQVEKERDALKTDIRKITIERRDLKAKVDRLMTQASKFFDANNQLKAENEKLDELKGFNERLLLSNEELVKERDELKVVIENKDRGLRAQRRLIKTLTKERDEAWKKRNEAWKKRDKLKAELERKETTRTDFRNCDKNCTCPKCIAELLQGCREIQQKAQIERLTKERDEFKAERDGARKERDYFAAERNKLRENLSKLVYSS